MSTNGIAINPDKYWAHIVYKVEKAGKPFIAGVLRKRYGDDFEDIDDSGLAEVTLGIVSERKKRKFTDTNPDSETFGERIEDPDDEGGELQQKFILPMTDEVVEEFRKMCGDSNYGSTQYVRLYHSKRPISAETLDELVEGDNTEIMREQEGLLKKAKLKNVRKSND